MTATPEGRSKSRSQNETTEIVSTFSNSRINLRFIDEKKKRLRKEPEQISTALFRNYFGLLSPIDSSPRVSIRFWYAFCH